MYSRHLSCSVMKASSLCFVLLNMFFSDCVCVCVESVLKELVDANVGLCKHHSYINNILKTFFLYPLAIREDACFVQIVQFWLSNT